MALRLRNRREHELFPGFTDVQEIGVGSLAVVFRARESGTNRQVALKLLNVRDASPRAVESFERESIALGALSSHPNIVTLYRTFRTPDGRPVLVLELCAGAVADRLHDGAGIPITDVVGIGIKIAGALETAHRAGILHRDVKPQNILVTEFGEPALADFGVAMLQSSSQTTAGLFDFTTLHAAPELLEGTGTSAATDVYELASSLYQLIAGQSAFRAYEGESPASVILRILRDPVRPLSGTGVPLALSDLLIRAMSKEKTERPPTAVEFAAELAGVEMVQRWPRTQYLIRAGGPHDIGAPPAITRLPGAAPREVASAHPVRPAVSVPPASPPVLTPPVPSPPVPSAAVQRPPVPSPPVRSSVATAPVRDVPVAKMPVPSVPPTQPPAVATPEARPRRVPIEIDDEYLPAPGPDRHWYAPRHQLSVRPNAPGPAAPLADGPAGNTTAVPVWAVRAPAERGPDVTAESPVLPVVPSRLTLRAGASAITVDERQLRLRTWLKRSTLRWAEIHGFEARLDRAEQHSPRTGHIVALTASGAIELPGTRRPLSELRAVHARLDEYRSRAQHSASS